MSVKFNTARLVDECRTKLVPFEDGKLIGQIGKLPGFASLAADDMFSFPTAEDRVSVAMVDDCSMRVSRARMRSMSDGAEGLIAE